MPRPSPQVTPVLSVTKNGRHGGSFGNYEIVDSSYVSQAGVSPYHRAYTGTVTQNYNNLRLSSRLLPYNEYVVEYNWVESGTPYRSDTQSYDGWTYFNEVSPCASRYTFTPLGLGLHNDLSSLAGNKAMMRLGEKLSGVRVNYAQFLGERKQTAELLASTAHRVVSAARALKRADLGTFTKSLSLSGTEARSVRSAWRRVENSPADKRIANHWLEFVYGWKPLLSDVYGTAEYLAERIHKQRYPSGVAVASGKATVSYSGPQLDKLMGHTKTWASYEATVSVKYKMHWRLDSEASSILAQTGITNPLLLGWELFPYSFVVDWFVPVGTYLESLTAFDGFSLIDGRSGKTQKTWVTYSHNYADSGKTPYPWSRSGSFTKKAFEFRRTTMSSWPSYVLKVRSPIGGDPLSRFLTAASLMRVLFR